MTVSGVSPGTRSFDRRGAFAGRNQAEELSVVSGKVMVTNTDERHKMGILCGAEDAGLTDGVDHSPREVRRSEDDEPRVRMDVERRRSIE